MRSPLTRLTKKVLRDNAKKIHKLAREIKADIAAKKAAEPVYEGRKNECIDEFFAEICCLTQNELKLVLPALLRQRGYEDIIVEDGYIYAPGEIPVVLTAHMDTVHKEPVVDYYEKDGDNGMHVLYSPQGIGGDDRCGIYMILRIVEQYKCSVIFCEDEEIGCVGSKKFCNTKYIEEIAKCKYMIGLDRAYSNDAVFYSCDNPEFTKFICDNTGFEKDYGSYSDISHLAPAAGIAAVNLSCGYYKAHTKDEYVVIEIMQRTIDKVKNLLEVECEQFEYIEEKYSYGDFYGSYYKYGDTVTGLVAYYNDEEGQENFVCAEGANEIECWGRLFTENSWLCFDDVIDFEIY